jgi:uncharacterized protein YdeI (BOF family)
MFAASGAGHWPRAMRLRVLRRAGIAWAALLLMSGCHQSNSIVLGKMPAGEPQPVSDVKLARLESPVTVQGVLVEKCPVAGCWFYLRDNTGEIKVDTKLAGFVVVDVPLQSRLTVSGRKVVAGNGECAIEAIGVRY